MVDGGVGYVSGGPVRTTRLTVGMSISPPRSLRTGLGTLVFATLSAEAVASVARRVNLASIDEGATATAEVCRRALAQTRPP